MRGIPVRIECGPKDIENRPGCHLPPRYQRKYVVSFGGASGKGTGDPRYHAGGYAGAGAGAQGRHTYVATDYETFKDTINNKPGFVKAMWCGCRECEDKIKEDVQATSDVCPLSRNSFPIPVCAAANRRKRWYIGDELLMKKLAIPNKVGKIIGILEQAGFEAYAVGGCVRDSLLGRTPDDWDITTSATPEQVKALFYRTVDTGLAHGTVTVLMDKEGFEVTTYRVDGDYEDGRHQSSDLYRQSGGRPESVGTLPSTPWPTIHGQALWICMRVSGICRKNHSLRGGMHASDSVRMRFGFCGLCVFGTARFFCGR